MLIEPVNMVSGRVRAFFTTRGFTGPDDAITGALERHYEIPPGRIYLPVQRHTSSVHVLDSDVRPVVADAVVTDRKEVYIGVVVADCVPVLLHDSRNGVIAAVHAGWKGTAQAILRKTIESMRDIFGCNAGDIAVAIGPSIRRCSYEVGEDVAAEVQRATGTGDYCTRDGGRYYLDLSSANKIQAEGTGVRREMIWQSDECTYCNPERFYSYRFAGGSTGRQGAFIGMW